MDEDHNDGHINSPRNSVGGVDQQRAREGSISQTVTFFYSTLKKKRKAHCKLHGWTRQKKEQKKLVDGCASEWIRLLSFTFCGFKVIFV